MRYRLIHLLVGSLIFLVFAFALPARGYEMAALTGYRTGTIVVKTSERKLYLAIGNGQALRYTVGVGRTGLQWSGTARIEGKYRYPAWAPHRGAPVIPGGSPKNPMGVAALTMRGGDYAIHGTNAPQSIGGFVSGGCIRMHNADVLELYRLVRVGTPVIVER